jgi:AraC-like DNA-binding protein
MIRNYNLQLLSGGLFHCDTDWEKDADGWDHCFKLYFPVKGSAGLIINKNVHSIKAGNIYFINGYSIGRQFCKESMDVYWIHFIPTSLKLQHVLQRIAPLHAWPAGSFSFLEKTYTRLDHLFKYRLTQNNELAPDCPVELPCLTSSMLLYLIGDLLSCSRAGELMQDDPVYQKLRDSIEFMDAHYKGNPSLKAIADRSFLAANYFHRLFTDTFGVTPFAYMLKRRLDTARQLLSNTTLSVKQVAKEVGYDNEFYFSRMFKKQFSMTPSQVKHRREIG